MIDVTKPEAIAALTAAAWTENGPEYEPCAHCGWREKEPRTLIHSYAGSFGADWTLEGAVAFVEGADKIVWRWSPMEHDLAVRSDGLVRSFEVRAPDDVRPLLLAEARESLRA